MTCPPTQVLDALLKLNFGEAGSLTPDAGAGRRDASARQVVVGVELATIHSPVSVNVLKNGFKTKQKQV